MAELLCRGFGFREVGNRIPNSATALSSASQVGEVRHVGIAGAEDHHSATLLRHPASCCLDNGVPGVVVSSGDEFLDHAREESALVEVQDARDVFNEERLALKYTEKTRKLEDQVVPEIIPATLAHGAETLARRAASKEGQFAWLEPELAKQAPRAQETNVLAEDWNRHPVPSVILLEASCGFRVPFDGTDNPAPGLTEAFREASDACEEVDDRVRHAWSPSLVRLTSPASGTLSDP